MRAAAVLASALVLLLAGCEREETTLEPVDPVDPVGVPGNAREARPAEAVSRLRLPRGGNPIVQVRRGERVALRDAPGGEVLKQVGDETRFGSPTAYAVQDVRRGWAGVPTAHFENGRLAWVRLDPRRLRADSSPWRIDVDLSEYTTTLLLRGEPVRRFAVSIGAPGSETPTGRFAVTDTFRGGLNPVYGCCAVAITARQTRVPSGWLGGDLIAIHGTDGPLGAAISNGCVRAADRDVNALVNNVPPGTPVVIHE